MLRYSWTTRRTNIAEEWRLLNKKKHLPDNNTIYFVRHITYSQSFPAAKNSFPLIKYPTLFSNVSHF